MCIHACKKDLWSQILCRLYRSPSDETINRGPPRVYTYAKRPHTHVKDPVVRVESSVDYGNNKITQHAVKMSLRVFVLLKLDTVRKKKK